MTIHDRAAVRGNWKKKKWLIIIVILAAVAVVSWCQWNKNHEEKTAIEPVKADSRVLAEGIVFPVKYAQMVMPVDGTIGEILAVEGDHVKAGQPIVRLMREDYQARVGSAWSDVARASASVEQARVNLADAEREFRRQQRMEDSGATSRQLIDQAKSAMERNQAALAQAQADQSAVQGKASEAER